MAERIIAIEKSGQELRISYPWRMVGLPKCDSWPLQVVTVFLCGLLVVWYVMDMRGPALMTAFASILAYQSAARRFNRTTIAVTPDQFAIRSGPLPWRPPLLIRENPVVHLLAQPAPRWHDSKLAYPCCVKAYFADGSRVMLVSALSPSDALLIENLIEAHLHLTHMEMPECPKCGYDLRGTPGRCPECGWRGEPVCPRCQYDLRGTPDHCPECAWERVACEEGDYAAATRRLTQRVARAPETGRTHGPRQNEGGDG